MTEKFPNEMNTRNPQIQESPTSSKDKKHKENYIRAHIIKLLTAIIRKKS